MGYVLAILALGFLIVVHEAGHYVVARWCKMRVERFSVGFGPGILKHKNKHGTVFQLAPLPFGGFVEIRGMNIAEEVDPEDLQAYPNRPAWQRFVTILAGPATNYVSAIFLAFGLYTCHGQPGDTYYVGKVMPGFDAMGKLEELDRIIAVDGNPEFSPSSTRLSELVGNKNGKPLQITVLRHDTIPLTFTIYPKLDGELPLALPARATQLPLEQREAIYRSAAMLASDHGFVSFDVCTLDKLRNGLELRDSTANAIEERFNLVRNKDNRPRYLIGFSPSVDYIPLGFFDATKGAFKYPVLQTERILGGFRDILVGKEAIDAGGPVRIVSEFESAFNKGLPEGVGLLMMLSVYLGLFNLFPLPALDGGRLVFLAYEMITRRRANPKIETMVHMGGIMVLMVVMILVTLGDFGIF
jgi:regulator of sigma E protease